MKPDFCIQGMKPNKIVKSQKVQILTYLYWKDVWIDILKKVSVDSEWLPDINTQIQLDLLIYFTICFITRY